MLFKRKKKVYQQDKVSDKSKETVDVLKIKDKGSSKLDNVPDEIVAKAIKDLLSKD